MSRRVLVVRLDSMGDVLICGPAVRAVAASGAEVSMLVGPNGAAAARLLPGVCAVLVWNCPWIAADPPPVAEAGVNRLIELVRDGAFDEAIVLTSFHQSALPTALLLRLAGIARIAACSTDYPGALLDQRIPEPAALPEPVRMSQLVAAAGYPLPARDSGALAVIATLPDPPPGLPPDYLVVHAGSAAPARTCSPEVWAGIAASLSRAGWQLVLTGGAAEAGVASMAAAAAGSAWDLSGQLELDQLATVLRGARAVVVGNTGPAHLAAAVGTPVASLFAPVVPSLNWAPFTDRLVLLGDQQAGCRGSRARVCPVAGHPCLDSITGDQVLAALVRLGVYPASADAGAVVPEVVG
ncbi:MAG: glycosyltransferase family 9 protein [Jatrophihabitantaceae bacterium]